MTADSKFTPSFFLRFVGELETKADGTKFLSLLGELNLHEGEGAINGKMFLHAGDFGFERFQALAAKFEAAEEKGSAYHLRGLAFEFPVGVTCDPSQDRSWDDKKTGLKRFDGPFVFSPNKVAGAASIVISAEPPMKVELSESGAAALALLGV